MTAPAEIVTDGRHDFDFFHGRWHGKQRKIVDILDKDCTDWVEFESFTDCTPALGGLGNLDLLRVSSLPPHGEPLDGLTVRLYDPATGVWRVWWSSSRSPGDLGVPVIGRFTGGVGNLYADEVVGGHLVRVHYHWRPVSDTEAHWEQRFSYDGGKTWTVNWTADFTRAA
ncbi:MAG: hypothetical protein ACRDT6_26260 [Micromonosporaceae bacterium]